MRKFTSHKNYTSQTSGLNLSPAALLNTEVIQVSGDPRTNDIRIDPSQLENGDVVDLLFIFTSPSVVGITFTIWNQTPEPTTLATIVSDGVQPNALLRFSADGCGGLQLIERAIPAFLS